MKHYWNAIVMAMAVTTFGACSGESLVPPGGEGGASSSSSSSSSSTGGGQGGEGGELGIRFCNTSGDCRGRYKTCEVELCWEGKCEAYFDALGVVCDPQSDPLAMCDGMGHCAAWDSSACFTPTPLEAECPLCDDGDPATGDTCVKAENGTPLENPYCTHIPIKEGWNCGQGFSIQSGQCCPW